MEATIFTLSKTLKSLEISTTIPSMASNSEITAIPTCNYDNSIMENRPTEFIPFKEFHPFNYNKLPLEIRRKIWGFAAPPPWLIMCKTNFWPFVERDTSRYTRQVPAVLCACKESREEFLYDEKIQRNHPTFRLVYSLATKNNGAVFISTEQDVLVIGSDGIFKSKDLQGMRRFAMLNHDDRFPFEKLTGFPNLEDLYVIDRNGTVGDCYSFDRWFRKVEKEEIRLLENEQKFEDWKAPKVTYLSKLHAENKVQSGPFFLGDAVERNVGDRFQPRRTSKFSPEPAADKMRCCLFGQQEAQDMEGCGKILTRKFRQMQKRPYASTPTLWNLDLDVLLISIEE